MSSYLNVLFYNSLSIYQRFLQYCVHNIVTPCIFMLSHDYLFHILSFLSSQIEEASISTHLVSSLYRLYLLGFTYIYFALSQKGLIHTHKSLIYRSLFSQKSYNWSNYSWLRAEYIIAYDLCQVNLKYQVFIPL